jgi:Dyp-type peroxidase family
VGLLQRPDLPTHEIQGDILPGFRNRSDTEFAQHFFLLEVAEPDRACEALRDLIPGVTTAAALVRQPGEPAMATSTNLGFTYAGLEMLAPEAGLDAALEAHVAFRAGLAERSPGIQVDGVVDPLPLLGDPADWAVRSSAVSPFHSAIGNDVHVVLNLGARDRDLLAEHVHDMKQRVAGGFRPPVEQPGALLGGEQVEPFGFADGLSQPLIEGYHEPPDPADGAPAHVPRPLPAAQFLLDGDDPITANGSFMVWVRFVMDRAAFDAHCAEAARELRRLGNRQATAAGVAALEVGRWPDGTSLTRRPLASRRKAVDATETFDYASDFYGRRCPRNAHARKMNPRTPDAREHAILRRGIPFQVDGEEGLVFVCYQASIDRQYEMLQAYWANVAYAPEANASPDPMISQAARNGCTVEIPGPRSGSWPVRIDNTWIRPSGGFYAFVPSISGLRYLLGG